MQTHTLFVVNNGDSITVNTESQNLTSKNPEMVATAVVNFYQEIIMHHLDRLGEIKKGMKVTITLEED